MSFKFKRLLEERKLVKTRLDKKLVLKEIDGALDVIETAEKFLSEAKEILRIKGGAGD